MKELEMDRDFQKAEYSEISTSLRHLNDVRLKIVQYCITLNGICLVFYGGIFSTLSSRKTANDPTPENQSAVAAHDLEIFFSSPAVLLAALSILVTLLSLAVELLSSRQFELLSNRGKAIEAEFGVIGQFHISLQMIEKRKGVSVMLTGVVFYLALIVFWGAFAFLSPKS